MKIYSNEPRRNTLNSFFTGNHVLPSKTGYLKNSSVSSVAQSCLTLHNSMDCSNPGSPVQHQLLKLTQTHIQRLSDTFQPSHLMLSPSLPAFNLSQHQGLPMNQFFASGGQSIGVSASASVLPMNIQDWFPLGRTGWISLQAKGLSRVFPTP